MLACGTREVPSHLQVAPPPEAQEALPPPRDLAEALQRIVGKDPLARRPKLPEEGWLGDLDAPGLRAWDTIARGTPNPGELSLLEDQYAGTVAVALSRGARLAAVEDMTRALLDGERASERSALLWLSPLTPAPELSTGRGPWAWLTALSPAHASLLAYGESSVMRGWLDGPGLPLDAVAAALGTPTYDRLSLSVEGQLVLAIAQRPAAEGAASLDDARLVAELLLERAAADRNSEQDAHRERCAALATERGLDAGDRDPLPAMVDAILAELVAQAPREQAVGAALLTWSVRRWLGGCPSCPGLDRSAQLDAALRWAPELSGAVAAARVAFLKDALDSLEVGLERARTVNAHAPLADALIGLGYEPPPLTWVERPTADAGLWLSLTRMIGGVEAATEEEGLAALRGALATHAQALAAREDISEEARVQAQRIARRAAK